MEINNYGESETNNNKEQNEHTIIVPDMQDVLDNQVKQNVSNSVRDNFFLMAKVQRKPTKGRTDYSF